MAVIDWSGARWREAGKKQLQDREGRACGRKKKMGGGAILRSSLTKHQDPNQKANNRHSYFKQHTPPPIGRTTSLNEGKEEWEGRTTTTTASAGCTVAPPFSESRSVNGGGRMERCKHNSLVCACCRASVGEKKKKILREGRIPCDERKKGKSKSKQFPRYIYMFVDFIFLWFFCQVHAVRPFARFRSSRKVPLAQGLCYSL